MGITKMWGSSDSDPFIANYYLYNIRHNFFLSRNYFSFSFQFVTVTRTLNETKRETKRVSVD